MADPLARLWTEIDAIRKTLYDRGVTLDGLRRRITDLERRVTENERVRDHYVPILDKMIQTDELQAFVEEQRQRGNTLRLSRLQKFAVALLGLPTFVLGIVEIVRLVRP